jgi:hypothetical protein
MHKINSRASERVEFERDERTEREKTQKKHEKGRKKETRTGKKKKFGGHVLPTKKLEQGKRKKKKKSRKNSWGCQPPTWLRHCLQDWIFPLMCRRFQAAWK